MILMYHHVCPPGEIPKTPHRLEGWQYNISPEFFELQLQAVVAAGFRFVSLEEYIQAMLSHDVRFHRMVTVTFDDGWRDNYVYARTVLIRHGVPATFFIVSREMSGVEWNARMSPDELRALVADGMTIGAHTRSHPNLTQISEQQLSEELRGCKADLEMIIDRPVRYFAYPGGRFNSRVVDATREAGFDAACSVIGWGRNSEQSMYWLFRETFSNGPLNITDRMKMNSAIRKLLGVRARARLRRILEGST